jgi:hypothetical protein
LTVGTANADTLYADVIPVIGGTDFLAVAAHVRNAGIGTAVITSAKFIFGDDVIVAGGAKDPAIPPSEGTSVTAQIEEGTPQFEQASARATETQDFSLAAEYADVSGRRRGAVRLDIKRRSHGEWWVRQVFWAGTIDDVRTNPKLGTQPAD